MFKINDNYANIDLTPINESIDNINNSIFNLNVSINQISNNLNLTTFTQSGQAMTAGSYFKMDDWLNSVGNSIEIYGIGSTGYNTIGFWHTIDNSIHLITESSVFNHSGYTDYKTNGWMNKSRAINLEGYVIDSLTNIGMYPWTDTIYDGYVFKYGLTYSGLRWDMPTLPEKVKSITYSYIFTDAGVSVNPVLSFTKMNDMDYFKFDNIGNSIVSGSYVLSYNGQHIGTLDLFNDSAAQYKVQDVKVDALNYSALSYKPMLLINATCGNLNIGSPCSLCTISSCELNNVSGNDAAQISIHHPKMNSDLNIAGFNNISLLSIENTEPQKDINFNNISFASLKSIICDNLNVDNAAQIDFNASNHYLNINNMKLNSVSTFGANFLSAVGNLKYGEFKDMNLIYMTMPTATTFFKDGGLVDNVKSISISSGTLSNFTFNDPEYLELYKATISGGELTAQQLMGNTALIKGIENVSIESLNTASALTFDGMKNLTINYAPNRGNNLIRNVEKAYFKIMPDFDQGIGVNSWHIDSLNSSRLSWFNAPYMSATSMTLYTGTVGWFGGVSTFNCDNLYNANTGKYTIKNVDNITLNNISFTGSNSIYINNFANLEINKINNNTGNVIYVNGQYLLQNNVKINNFEGLKTMHLDEISQLKLENGTVSNLFVEGNTQNLGALTLSSLSIDNAYFSNLSYADFGNGSCDELNVSNVLNCEHPFSYCHDVYIDAAHSANLTNYVLSWQVSHVI